MTEQFLKDPAGEIIKAINRGLSLCGRGSESDHVIVKAIAAEVIALVDPELGPVRVGRNTADMANAIGRVVKMMNASVRETVKPLITEDGFHYADMHTLHVSGNLTTAPECKIEVEAKPFSEKVNSGQSFGYGYPISSNAFYPAEKVGCCCPRCDSGRVWTFTGDCAKHECRACGGVWNPHGPVRKGCDGFLNWEMPEGHWPVPVVKSSDPMVMGWRDNPANDDLIDACRYAADLIANDSQNPPSTLTLVLCPKCEKKLWVCDGGLVVCVCGFSGHVKPIMAEEVDPSPAIVEAKGGSA